MYINFQMACYRFSKRYCQICRFWQIFYLYNFLATPERRKMLQHMESTSSLVVALDSRDAAINSKMTSFIQDNQD